MRSNIRIFICLWLISTGILANSQPSESKIIKDFLTDPQLTGSSVGIMVREVTSGEILLARNSKILLAPASTLKLVTSAAALEILGPDHRFTTTLGFTGHLDQPSGILDGNLVVKGGGDPSLGSVWLKDQIPQKAFADQWVAELKKKGVVKISGGLVVDVSAYEGPSVPGNWTWEDIGNYYGAGPSAITFFDNMIRLYFNSPTKAGEPVSLVRTEPEVPGITWQNEVLSSAINRDMAYVYGSPWGEKRKITGTIPAGRTDFLVKASMPEPPAVFGNYLCQQLRKAGIVLEGEVRVSGETADFQVLDVHKSPCLADILTPLNQESINLFADHLVFQTALKKTSKGSFEAGLEVIRQFWKDNGVRDTFFMDDGSGLSRFNAISAEQLNTMLLYMSGSKNAEVFKQTLPSAGTGTLSGFSTVDFPGKSLQCKSGSIDKVRAYAGYLLCDSGREVAFAILVNNFSCTMSEMGKKLQKLILEIKKAY